MGVHLGIDLVQADHVPGSGATWTGAQVECGQDVDVGIAFEFFFKHGYSLERMRAEMDARHVRALP